VGQRLYLNQLCGAATEALTLVEIKRLPASSAAAQSGSGTTLRGLKAGLTEEERYAVADHAVAQLKERGDSWRLNEEAPTAKPP
jgi:hypothetical protein